MNPENHNHWEHFDHQADIGIRGFGDSISDAFANCAYALSAVICNPDTVIPMTFITIECSDQEPEALLFDWLGELLAQMDITGMLFSRFDVTITDDGLTARVFGEKADPEKHEISVQVKAPTYTLLKVEIISSGRWVAQCVVDV